MPSREPDLYSSLHEGPGSAVHRGAADPAGRLRLADGVRPGGADGRPTARRRRSSNLTGTWTGTGTDAQGAETFTWTVTQTGDRLSGSVVLDSANRNDGSCGSCHKQKSGTLAGTLSGGALTLTLDFPAGGSDITPLCGITMHATHQRRRGRPHRRDLHRHDDLRGTDHRRHAHRDALTAILPPFADSISFTSASVIAGSSPSVCPLSRRTTSATTRPSLQSGIDEDARLARRRQQAPRRHRRILTAGVVHVAGLRVGDLDRRAPRAAAEALAPTPSFPAAPSRPSRAARSRR